MKLFFDREGDTVFEALFGRSVIAWNSTETDVRNFLLYLASDCGNVRGLGPWILVAEMGTRHISQTIQAYADATIDDKTTKDLVHHVAVLFENLVSYRNHYVHGLIHIVENVGQIGATTAKSKFKVVHGEVPIEEMGAFIDKVGELADFVYETLEYLKTGGTSELPALPALLPTLVKQTTLLPLRQTSDDATPDQ